MHQHAIPNIEPTARSAFYQISAKNGVQQALLLAKELRIPTDRIDSSIIEV